MSGTSYKLKVKTVAARNGEGTKAVSVMRFPLEPPPTILKDTKSMFMWHEEKVVETMGDKINDILALPGRKFQKRQRLVEFLQKENEKVKDQVLGVESAAGDKMVQRKPEKTRKTMNTSSSTSSSSSTTTIKKEKKNNDDNNNNNDDDHDEENEEKVASENENKIREVETSANWHFMDASKREYVSTMDSQVAPYFVIYMENREFKVLPVNEWHTFKHVVKNRKVMSMEMATERREAIKQLQGDFLSRVLKYEGGGSGGGGDDVAVAGFGGGGDEDEEDAELMDDDDIERVRRKKSKATKEKKAAIRSNQTSLLYDPDEAGDDTKAAPTTTTASSSSSKNIHRRNSEKRSYDDILDRDDAPDDAFSESDSENEPDVDEESDDDEERVDGSATTASIRRQQQRASAYRHDRTLTKEGLDTLRLLQQSRKEMGDDLLDDHMKEDEDVPLAHDQQDALDEELNDQAKQMDDDSTDQQSMPSLFAMKKEPVKLEPVAGAMIGSATALGTTTTPTTTSSSSTSASAAKKRTLDSTNEPSAKKSKSDSAPTTTTSMEAPSQKEIREQLLLHPRITIANLLKLFKRRVQTPSNQAKFTERVKELTRMENEGGQSYLVLREEYRYLPMK
jgi:hypothetical protein